VLILLSAIPAAAAGKKIFITKTDENFNGQPNVTFELYQDTNGNGKLDAGEPKVDTQVTDAAGKATFANVAPGTYIVHEVAPAGYVQPPDEPVAIAKKNKEIVFSNTRQPANNRVNDPTGDTSVDDGTHVFDFGAALAVACEEEQNVAPSGVFDDCQTLAAWNHSAGFQSPGGVSGSMSGLSTDLGQTWGNYAKAPTGPNSAALGEPSVVWDPTTNRFYYAYDAVTNTGAGIQFHINLASSGGPFGFWNNPVNVTPASPLSPAVAHTPSTVIDPATGDIIITYTQSLADGTSQTVVTRSSDGGNTFSLPVPVSDVSHNDFSDVAPAPRDRVYITYNYFGDNNDNSFFVARSNDGGATWSAPVNAGTVPKTGTPGLCQGSTTRTVFGQVIPHDAPEIAVSPFNRNRLFVTFPGHGQGGDEGDIFLTISNDGGQTWSPPETVGETSGTQFSPTVDVTPDGRVVVAYYDARQTEPAEVDWAAVFYNVFSGRAFSQMTFTSEPFPIWQMNPSFDTNYSNCFGLPPGAINAAGSGFFTAWTDGRDPGPAGNDGIDPNIYFAHTEGPLLATALTLQVSTTFTKVKVTGEVVPRPLAGARVSVTLFVNEGDGFDKVAKKRPTTDKAGAWATSFGRPAGGTCRIVAVFEGSEGREPSPTVRRTFSC
jgi:hypothetical protein